MTWLMQQSAIDNIERLRASMDAAVVIAALESIEARTPHEMTVKKGGIATIQIKGPLLAESDDYLDYFGVKYTIYSEIENQVAEAVGRNANRIDFEIDSPGGTVEGLYRAMGAIAGAPPKTRAIAGSTMASAAYMLASQANRIEASGDLSLIGSIGVATSGFAIDFIKDIANTDSPKKRPNLSTDDGIKVVQEELDDIYNVLAERIAEGRGVDTDTIKNDYGQGAMMTARTALKKKMIDGIIEDKPESTATKTAAEKQGDKMDAKTLKEEHRDTYNAIVAIGVANGVKAERDRVNAHLVAAEGGDLNAAHEAITSGEDYSDLVKAKHDAFARKEQMKSARVDDNPPDINADADDHIDPQLEMKKGMEAACPGLEWEVM